MAKRESRRNTGAATDARPHPCRWPLQFSTDPGLIPGERVEARLLAGNGEAVAGLFEGVAPAFAAGVGHRVRMEARAWLRARKWPTNAVVQVVGERSRVRRRFMLAAKRYDTATLVLVWERNLPCVD